MGHPQRRAVDAYGDTAVAQPIKQRIDKRFAAEGGLVFIFFDFGSVFDVSLIFGRLITMKAETAFFHNPPHSHRHIGIQRFLHPFGPYRVPPVEVPDMIGTCGHAVSAPETTGIDLADDTGCQAVVGCCGRTNRDAWGMAVIAVAAAVHTWPGQIANVRIRP